MLGLSIALALVAALLTYRSRDQPPGPRAPRRMPWAGRKIRVPGAEPAVRPQAQGLDSARVVVHRAYDYSGQSPHPPGPGEKLVAVDTEFTGTARGFDLDDVDIVDAATGRDHGGSSAFRPVLPDGRGVDWGDRQWEAHSDATGSIRFLFLYKVPSATRRVTLNYWGKTLTPAPVALAPDGPSLPERPAKLAP